VKKLRTRHNLIGAKLDRAIAVVAPAWAEKRMAARHRAELRDWAYRDVRVQHMRAQRGTYAGADKNRTLYEFNPPTTSADSALLDGDMETLRDRSRALNRDDALSASITQTVCDNVIGTGLRPQAQVDAERVGITPEKAREYCKAAEQAWKTWGRTADATNYGTIYDLQELVQRESIEAGDIFALPLMLDDQFRKFSLAVELVPGERVDTPPDLQSDPAVRAGVRLGPRGQPTAYYISKTAPGDETFGDSSPLEFFPYTATNEFGPPNVLHRFLRRRARQTRGEPLLTPVIKTLHHLEKYMESEMVAARAGANIAAIIVKQDLTGFGFGEEGADVGIEDLEPGSMPRLRAGESVTPFIPNRPNSAVEPFMNLLIRGIGAAVGQPYEMILRDFSKTNYSSARAAIVQANRTFRRKQKFIVDHFCYPLYYMLIEEAVLLGELPITRKQFEADPEAWCEAVWLTAGSEWVDPAKEVQASALAVQNNLSTSAIELGRQGLDWEEVFQQRAREKELEKELGIEVEPPPPAAGFGAKPGAKPGQDAPADESVPADEQPANAELELEPAEVA
jgi:lambda family phage portal protein